MECEHGKRQDRCKKCSPKEYKKQLDRVAAYQSANMIYHKGSLGHIGAAAEHAVLSDLNRRGLDVTQPTNHSSPHDMHVRASGRWITVQVKATGINQKTGDIQRRKRSTVKDITSELIAWVLPDFGIKYESNTPHDLPDELKWEHA